MTDVCFHLAPRPPPVDGYRVSINPSWSMCKLSAMSAPFLLQLLNCIMDMVEKTRRSLTVLRRCQEADREELNYWIRRYSDAEELKKGAASGQSRQQSPAAQENATPGSHGYAYMYRNRDI